MITHIMKHPVFIYILSLRALVVAHITKLINTPGAFDLGLVMNDRGLILKTMTKIQCCNNQLQLVYSV